MSTNLWICFDVVGSIQQELKILQEDVTIERVVEKLNTGEYLTTLEKDESTKYIITFDEEGNEVNIAEIIKQRVVEEMEYSRFQGESYN